MQIAAFRLFSLQLCGGAAFSHSPSWGIIILLTLLACVVCGLCNHPSAGLTHPIHPLHTPCIPFLFIASMHHPLTGHAWDGFLYIGHPELAPFSCTSCLFPKGNTVVVILSVCLSVTLLSRHNHTNNFLLPVVICFMLGSYPSAESGVSLAYLASSLTITAFTCATFIA